MRTETISIYKFDELTEDQKQLALEKWRESGIDDHYNDERVNSYKGAEQIFDELESIEGEIKGKRLYAYIQNNLSCLWTDNNHISKHEDGTFKNCYYNYKYDCVKSRMSNIFKTNNLENCPLTGVCYDYDFLQPIIDFMNNPAENVSNIDLVDEFPSYESVAERDYIWMNSDEYIIEAIEANEYEFYEDGKLC